MKYVPHLLYVVRKEKMYEKEIAELQKIIDESSRIVFFGGAGVSTESGIPDFRSADGIYHQKYKYSPEQVVSHSFFIKYPEAFYEFYKEKMMMLDAKPNPAHLKLAELEAAGKLQAVVTQNIDGLHQAAGSKKVYELHGSIHRNYCMKCGKFYDAEYVKNRKVYRTVPVAARSNRMWYYMKKDWMQRQWMVPSGQSVQQIH